jgi:hypothetical protein
MVMMASGADWTIALLRASLAARESSIRLRSVMSCEMPMSPTTLPLSSRCGETVETYVRIEPSEPGTATSLVSARPVRNTLVPRSKDSVDSSACVMSSSRFPTTSPPLSPAASRRRY